ncbi:hypothetical protein BD779DRAFT_1477314 [Infundibulicybe gibba]|nr:hypothetical protein BD779DRAFT_1477314 [Infundibulicybe gibba]
MSWERATPSRKCKEYSEGAYLNVMPLRHCAVPYSRSYHQHGGAIVFPVLFWAAARATVPPVFMLVPLARRCPGLPSGIAMAMPRHFRAIRLPGCFRVVHLPNLAPGIGTCDDCAVPQLKQHSVFLDALEWGKWVRVRLRVGGEGGWGGGASVAGGGAVGAGRGRWMGRRWWVTNRRHVRVSVGRGWWSCMALPDAKPTHRLITEGMAELWPVQGNGGLRLVQENGGMAELWPVQGNGGVAELWPAQGNGGMAELWPIQENGGLQPVQKNGGMAELWPVQGNDGLRLVQEDGGVAELWPVQGNGGMAELWPVQGNGGVVELWPVQGNGGLRLVQEDGGVAELWPVQGRRDGRVVAGSREWMAGWQSCGRFKRTAGWQSEEGHPLHGYPLPCLLIFSTFPARFVAELSWAWVWVPACSAFATGEAVMVAAGGAGVVAVVGGRDAWAPAGSCRVSGDVVGVAGGVSTGWGAGIAAGTVTSSGAVFDGRA